jgi:hypothetical protein
MSSNDRLTFKAVKEALGFLNMRIDSTPGEYRVNFKHANKEPSAYYTEDLRDAMQTGEVMAKHAPKAPAQAVAFTGQPSRTPQP